jgi:hypothetical protein
MVPPRRAGTAKAARFVRGELKRSLFPREVPGKELGKFRPTTPPQFVMAGLVPAIYDFNLQRRLRRGCSAQRPGMTLAIGPG